MLNTSLVFLLFEQSDARDSLWNHWREEINSAQQHATDINLRVSMQASWGLFHSNILCVSTLNKQKYFQGQIKSWKKGRLSVCALYVGHTRTHTRDYSVCNHILPVSQSAFLISPATVKMYDVLPLPITHWWWFSSL